MDLRRAYHPAWLGLQFLLCFAILWKGGKSLETTWLLVGIAAALVLVVWAVRRRQEHDFDVHPAVWAAAMGFGLWTILSFSASETQNYGLDEVLRDGSLVLVIFAAIRGVQMNRTLSDRLLVVLAVSACLAALIGIPVYALQPVSRFVGTFFDMRFDTDYWPNAWAQFVLLAWPAVLFWAWHTARKRLRILRIVLLGVLLGGLLLSFSRGAMLAFAGQLVLGCLLVIHRYRDSLGVVLARSAFAAIALSCLALTTFVGANLLRSHSFAVESVLRKATFSADEGTSSVDERSQFWRQAWTLSWERPLVGHGPYSFRFTQPRLQEAVYATSDHPHNVFLKFAAERGWPAAILFALLIALVLLRSLSAVLMRAGDGEQLPLLIAASGVVAHSLIDFNLQFVGIALPFWLVMGLMEGRHSPSTASSFSLRSRRAAETIVAVLLVGVALIEAPYLVISSLGRHAEARGDLAAAQSWYDASRHQLFSRDLHLSRATLALVREDFSASQEALDDYMEHNAEDARAWLLQAALQEAEGDWDAAQHAYEEAFQRGRYNYLRTLRLLLETAERREDDTFIETMETPALELMQAYATAINQNAHFIALSDNVEEFLATTELLSALYPAREAKLEILAAAVDRHAKEERARFSAREPGMLW